MAVVEAHELTRRFGDLTAVENVSFSIEKGEVLAFLGPNGAGKTTTIRMLSGLISATSGYGVVAGNRTDGDVDTLHESIGLLTETPGFYDNLSARYNLEYFASFYRGVDAPSQIEKYLKAMGLWARREKGVGTFSKGMKQRLALVRALLHEPEVLFLDEPTAGLDPEAAGEVRDLIKRLSREERTILLSTHNLAEAELLCNRIAIVRTNLLVLDTVENLRRKLFSRQIVLQLEFMSEAMLDTLRGLPFVRKLETREGKLYVELADPDKNRSELVKRVVEAGGGILSVTEEGHSMEEVYLSLVRDSEPDEKKTHL